MHRPEMSRASDQAAQPRYRLPPIVSLTLGLAAAALFVYIGMRDVSDGDVRLFRMVFDRNEMPVLYWIGISVEFLVPTIFVIAVSRRMMKRSGGTQWSFDP